MTLSVLTTVYNRERSILRAVESILRQEYADFEYVIVDDGSTDATMQRLASITDERVRVIARKHEGRAASLNAGLAACSGSLIAIMDSDDEAQADRLAKQLDFLEHQPDVAMLGCHVLVRDETTGKQRVIAFPEHHEDILHGMPVTSMLPFNSSIIRRQVFDTVGGFDEALPAGEDYAFQLRALRHFRFHNLPSVLNTVQRSFDSLGVASQQAQDRVTREASAAFLAEEQRDPCCFPSPRALEEAQARAAYYHGRIAEARKRYFHLLLHAPQRLTTLRYLIPTFMGRGLQFLRNRGILSRITTPLRSLRSFRRHILP
ncbi:glycosyltransferase [bacterium]|nr:glycosyltransferase [bacterium]